jgi:hypothetical protein
VKCMNYGVACDFSGEKGELDVRVMGVGRVDFEEAVMDPRSTDNMPSTVPPNYLMSSNLGTPRSAVSINSTMASMIEDSLRSGYSDSDVCSGTGTTSRSASSSWKFSETHLEILTRFQSRTSLTVGGMNRSPAYDRNSFRWTDHT